MTLIATTIGLSPFIILFFLVFTWSFVLLFNHEIIEKYSPRLHVAKSKINEFLQESISKKYRLSIIHVDEDENDNDNDAEKFFQLSKDLNDQFKQKLIDRLVGVIFSLVITLSIELIVLMMCELTDTFNRDSRLLSFKFIINVLIVLITIIQPFIIISLYINQEIFPIHASNIRRIVTSAVYILWFVILHRFGHLSQSFSPKLQDLHNARSLIERKINEIVIGGITITAILSGIGSVSTPYDQLYHASFFNKFKRLNNENKEIGANDINSLIQSYNHTLLLLSKRKNDLDKLMMSSGGTIYNMPHKSSENLLSSRASPVDGKMVRGMLHRVQSFATLSNITKEKLEDEELADEINSLDSLRNNIYDDLMKLIHKFEMQQEHLMSERKFLKKIINIGMSLFSIYCIYRIVSVLLIKLPYYYLFHDNTPKVNNGINVEGEQVSKTTRDALAVTAAKLVQSIFQLPVSEDQLINQISFILSGSLFLGSFSNVLMTLKSVGKVFPSLIRLSSTTKNQLKHLIIGELLAIYVISTALLMRTNLPTHLSNQISQILSLSGSSLKLVTADSIREIEFIDFWFDKIFALTSIAAIVIIILKRVVSSDDFKDNYDEYDEEMIIENDNLFKTA